MSSINTQHQMSLRNQIFDYLRKQIEKGALTPGSLINTKQLTEDLEISRTPLREALAQMEVQGLVTIMPQRGVKLNALSYDQLIDIFEILGALESQVLDRVFERIDSKRINSMERINEQMSKYIDAGKNRQFHDANIQLHRIFIDLSDNSELVNFISHLKLKLFGFALKCYRDRFKRAIVQEHRDFISLLRAGEKQSAIMFLKDTHWKFNFPENFISLDDSKTAKCS